MPASTEKPHIVYHDYDGCWCCFQTNGGIGFGDTPVHAFTDFLLDQKIRSGPYVKDPFGRAEPKSA